MNNSNNNNNKAVVLLLIAFGITAAALGESSDSPRQLRHRKSNTFTWQLTEEQEQEAVGDEQEEETVGDEQDDVEVAPTESPVSIDIFDTNDDYQSRIVGGVTAPIDAYPFYVNWGGQCGASLVGKEWLMSAAHCDPIGTNTVRINRSRGVGYNVGRGELATIIDRFPHPQYNGNSHDNDIMLMRLAEPVDDFDPIPLNFDENIPYNRQDLKVIGFGRLESGGSSPSTLQEVIVKYVDTDTCNADDAYGGSINDDTMLCAGVDGGGKDSCQGDSGGPIFTMNNNGNSYSQVGVVSWGRGCARPDKPGVYARVSQYEQWIKNLVCNDDSEHYTQYKPDFCSNSPPTDNDLSWPVAPPTSNRPPPTSGDGVEIELRITFDDYPDETSWSFTQFNTQVGKGDGQNSFGGDYKTFRYTLQPGPAIFRIDDTMQDGICCGFGRGSYDLFAIVGADGALPVEENRGDFGDSETISFVVPSSSSDGSNNNDPPTSPPTRPPTSAPTSSSGGNVPTRPPTSMPTLPPNSNGSNNCQDSSSSTSFYVDSDVGNRDCQWLSSNMDYFQYLCQFFDVAQKCKVTCDVCQYFDEYATNSQS